MSNPLRLTKHRHVFTYGSLMFEPVWRSVVVGHYAHRRAVLNGYQRHAIRGELYPAVVLANVAGNAPSSAVIGRLYLDVAPDDLDRLDRFEGAQYRRITCQVSEPETRTLIDADVYLFLEPDLLLPHDWDEQQFATRGIAEFMKSYAPKT